MIQRLALLYALLCVCEVKTCEDGNFLSIFGETAAGAGGNDRSLSLPLAAEAGAESGSAVLGWKKVGEVNGRQDEEHRFQHLLLRST